MDRGTRSGQHHLGAAALVQSGRHRARSSAHSHGYQARVVVGVGSGSAAIEHLRNGARTDLVLTDWRLPGADGLAVLDAAKALDSSLPVVVMTAFGSIETAVDAMKRGAEDFITKPVDPELLRLLVARAIELARRRPGLKAMAGSTGQVWQHS